MVRIESFKLQNKKKGARYIAKSKKNPTFG